MQSSENTCFVGPALEDLSRSRFSHSRKSLSESVSDDNEDDAVPMAWQQFTRFLMSFPAGSHVPVQYELFGWFLEMTESSSSMTDICTEFSNILKHSKRSW
eukprot:Gregarina_sp_Poly_1__7132@NODE_3901_length_830_cov_101_433814_g2519_i0_p1_GENE_NODE_3901_length_830_cov_101_433814_g2519_i0NODE_3901_length_830_cov_101_433814_g2519_i0_p1_ORF_typecomplete_len101_score13_55Mus7/PF09462_10/0_03Orexin_rec2/PF03827_13/3_8Orexin_rec2/PF03827_13/85_NODE_3901_length_830_cov_101_433814_g2519_i0409711